MGVVDRGAGCEERVRSAIVGKGWARPEGQKKIQGWDESGGRERGGHPLFPPRLSWGQGGWLVRGRDGTVGAE